MKENNGFSEEIINNSDRSSFPAEKSAVDIFYEKLQKLHECSGLSLLFNLRQTSFDLYKFYEQVTVRGGYHQVTKDRGWGVVASNMSREGGPLPPHQFQKIYENVICPYEQMHHYRTSAKVDPISDNTSSCLNCLTKNRKHPPVSIICYDAKQVASTKRKGQSSIEEKSIGETSKGDEDIPFQIEVPVRPRSAFQLFIVNECKRLKKAHRESSNTRELATKAWKKLTDEERKTYIKESKRDKKRYDREIKTYNDKKNTTVLKPRKRPSYKENKQKSVVSSSKMDWPIKDGDYHVTVQPAPENILLPKESDVELAIRSVKNEPENYSVFQINLEEYW